MHLFICGYDSCSFHQRAVVAASNLEQEGKLQVTIEEGGRNWYFRRLSELKKVCKDRSAKVWKTSPFVYFTGGSGPTFIGGCDELIELLQELYPDSPGVTSALQQQVWRDGKWSL